MKYIEPVFRPPAEADSLILQLAYGCPHNSCRFCGMYKTVRYRQREMNDVFREIDEAATLYPDESRIFLADGDMMFLESSKLKAILEKLNASFRKLARVTLYANGSSILAKSPDELKELRNLKLSILYMGLETGDEEILKLVNKKENVSDMVKAVKQAQECGLKCSVMILLGLGGKAFSERHALATASALNDMQPSILSALRFIEVPGLKMYEGYETVTEFEAVNELKMMIENFELKKTVFRANHTSNPVPLAGRFPQDKAKLLQELDVLLNSKYLDRKGPGRQPFYL